MTKEQLEFLIREGLLVELLAQRVVEKLLQRQRQALVVFTGARSGQEEALESLSRLKREGYRFWVLLSQSAASNLDVARIRAELEPEQLWIGAPDQEEQPLAARFDTILVPTATVYTVSQVALCMAATPAASVILDGLMRGKRVIVATDGCCPDHPLREADGFRLNEAMKQTMRSHLELLQGYGARLTSARGIAKAVSGGGTASAPAQTEQTPPQESRTGNQELRVDSRVISGSHVRSCPPGSTLWVPGSALITQLAQDEARTRMVHIRKQT